MVLPLVKGSPKFLQFILWGTWMSELNLVAIYEKVPETFNTKPQDGVRGISQRDVSSGEHECLSTNQTQTSPNTQTAKNCEEVSLINKACPS